MNTISLLYYFQICSHHAWLSFDASAESYNELNRETSNTNMQNLEQYLNLGKPAIWDFLSYMHL